MFPVIKDGNYLLISIINYFHPINSMQSLLAIETYTFIICFSTLTTSGNSMHSPPLTQAKHFYWTEKGFLAIEHLFRQDDLICMHMQIVHCPFLNIRKDNDKHNVRMYCTDSIQNVQPFTLVKLLKFCQSQDLFMRKSRRKL